MHVDLDIDMRDGAPLLAGGRGTWIYGTADYFGGYPSRSFQYSQAAQTINGSIAIQQPDGSVLAEQVDPSRSSMVLVHEYDATPEDIPVGLALTTATQLHHRFIQEYQGGIPWELMYFDIGNGAQLQLLVQAYHDTEHGTVGNAGGVFSVPTYRVMGTVRLPNGQSAAVDDRLSSSTSSTGRSSGGCRPRSSPSPASGPRRGACGSGSPAAPPPRATARPSPSRPSTSASSRSPTGADTFVDANGDGLNQRVALRIAGTWDRCPVDGAGWSELIVNWTGQTDRGPVVHGRRRPRGAEAVHEEGHGRCPGRQRPAAHADGRGRRRCPIRRRRRRAAPPASVSRASCTFTATHEGAVGGYAAEPGGWTVTIERAGRDPIVVRGFTGTTTYGCGIIQPGDVVHAEAGEGSYVNAGNPHPLQLMYRTSLM